MSPASLRFSGQWLILVALLVTAGDLRGQVDSPPVGQRVVTKYQTPLRAGPRVVDDDRTFRVYTVERADGGWLWLTSGPVGGWAPAGAVVPFDRAIDFYTREVRADPANAAAYNKRGLVWQEKGEPDNALADYTEAIRLNPNNAGTFANRGTAWQAKRDYDRAIADYTEAILLDPKLAASFDNRGVAWRAKREYDRAIADYTEAVRIDPEQAMPLLNRAWLWATCPEAKYRDGKRAVASATRACELSGWKDPYGLDTLAAAYAEAGDFARAIVYQQVANDLYQGEQARRKGEERLALYRDGKPYREEPGP